MSFARYPSLKDVPTLVTGGATATFYNNLTNSGASEFRVSQGSSAVFIGNVSGLSQFTGPGTKVFEGGASAGRLATGGSTVIEDGGEVIATAIRERDLTVRGNGAIAVNGTTSRLESLTIEPGGRLDLNNNALIVNYTPPDVSPLDTIRRTPTTPSERM